MANLEISSNVNWAIKRKGGFGQDFGGRTLIAEIGIGGY